MPSALITAQELAQALEAANPPVVLDASWHMPATSRHAAREFAEKHILTARFFDIEAIRDCASPYPHMLPTPAEFADALGALGVRETDDVVVYDSVGLFSAPRAWWMLRVMGHQGSVRVLNGGFPVWKGAIGSNREAVIPTTYHVDLQPHLVADWRDVAGSDATILDARSAPRFAGAEPEPRAGLRAGHIPRSHNLHYARLIDESGRLKPRDPLEEIFGETGMAQRPIITSCGSGVTACILALGLHEIGQENVRVYDGSWAEWGSRTDLPLEVGV